VTCSVPKLFGLQKWFDKKFGDICDEHDYLYLKFCPAIKTYSDFKLAWRFISRGYPLLGILGLIYCSTFGSVFWIYHRARKLMKGEI